MKKLFLIFVVGSLLLLSSCGGKCEHVDSDGNFICDECEESLGEENPPVEPTAPCEHRDEDKNKSCDECAAFVDCKKKHNTMNGKCTVCGIKESSEGMLFEFNEDRTAYILTGLGTCKETDIVIGTINNLDVIEISEYAFSGKTQIKSVTIESGVLKINYDAFSDCSGLESVVLPSSLTEIRGGAFENCQSLKSVNIPNSVTIIGENAFKDCASLKDVSISNNVELFGKSVFENCTSLSCVEYGNAYYIGNSENPYFLLISAKSTEIENSVIHYDTRFVHSYAFRLCKNIKSVEVGKSVVGIGYCAFGQCTNLESVSLPASLKAIELYAFENCINIENLYIEDVASWCATEIRSPLCAENIFLDGTLLTDLVVPSGVTSVAKNAFYSCQSIKSVTLPDGLLTIGDSAFKQCSGISSISIPSSVTSIGSSFFGCLNLKRVVIEAGKRSINESAFFQCKIEYADVPASAIKFVDNNSLEELVINSDRDITNGILTHSPNLKTVVIKSGVKRIHSGAFSSCKNIESVTFENPDEWWYTTNQNATSGTAIDSSELSDPAVAAVSLTETYNGTHWRCGTGD